MAVTQAGHMTLTRDQRRALHAYSSVSALNEEERSEYQVAVNDLGVNILRHGLCAALAAIQRSSSDGSAKLLGHLAEADLPGLEVSSGIDLVRRVRELDSGQYMMISREVIEVATWLKRAAQASSTKK